MESIIEGLSLGELMSEQGAACVSLCCGSVVCGSLGCGNFCGGGSLKKSVE